MENFSIQAGQFYMTKDRELYSILQTKVKSYDFDDGPTTYREDYVKFKRRQGKKWSEENKMPIGILVDLLKRAGAELVGGVA